MSRYEVTIADPTDIWYVQVTTLSAANMVEAAQAAERWARTCWENMEVIEIVKVG